MILSEATKSSLKNPNHIAQYNKFLFDESKNLKIALDQKPADNKYGSTIMLNLIGQYFYILNEN